jgi:hypothetical protein
MHISKGVELPHGIPLLSCKFGRNGGSGVEVYEEKKFLCVRRTEDNV